ncbi:MAG: hypothetical protein AB7R89_02845 [Dehalococcoidia bacterium]
MPWKKKTFGGFEYSGNMKQWMIVLEQWHREDLGKDTKIPFDLYVSTIVRWYLYAYRFALQNEPPSGLSTERVKNMLQEIAPLEMLLDNPKTVRLAALDAVDLLATRMVIQELHDGTPASREFAKQVLGGLQ